MKVYILGSGAAVPTANRGVSSVAVQIDRDWLLIDCGEGTQVQMQRFSVRWGKINHILISHLHGDHYFGLPGLIFTYHLYNRKKPLNIYSPPGLKSIIGQLLQTSLPNLSYPIVFHEFQPERPYGILSTKYFDVTTFPLVHRVTSNGFLIRTSEGDRKIKPEFIADYQPDRHLLRGIQLGNDYPDGNGDLISNATITLKGRRSVSFAYVSDTSFAPEIAEHILSVDLLYHEATFPDGEAALAKSKGHCTSGQAAAIAHLAGAGQLVMGHLSPRIKSLDDFLNQAIAVFPNTTLAADGQVYEIKP
ncbi:MAG: hypothetical protein A2X11_02080 [Bacteroidetes bacterium GWE2_42_24]|nr:MAG: hypothetical protein A2X11_02080 [Bacteroidetes bacterium GWE2_42_24]OFY29067.1 MAG: hypothetical protein A2X09_16030 [Bacteroidetes bacterium GWF2_43_11]PKP26038.1 MAG: ribonuclease [Bacteroidetes bacterium HGW-Bacteroidetes-22]